MSRSVSPHRSGPRFARCAACRRGIVVAAIVAGAMVGLCGTVFGPMALREIRSRLGRATVTDRVAEVAPRVARLWRARLETAGLTEMPTQLTIVTNKAQRELLVLVPTQGAASGSDPAFVELVRYPIQAASGGPGPKLREGDNQVPEGSIALNR